MTYYKMVLRVLTCLAVCVHFVSCVVVTLEDGRSGSFAKEVEEGTNPILACSYSISSTGSQSDANIEWKYTTAGSTSATQHIVYNGVVVDQFKDQFSVQQPSSLQITNVNRNNKGFYICAVTIIADSPSEGVGVYNLTVLVAPSAPVCGFPSDHALTIGFSTQFTCNSAEGVPSPFYTWYKNGVALPDQESTDNPQSIAMWANTSFTVDRYSGVLTFKKVVSGDAGNYHCVSQNKVGTKQCQAVEIVTKNQDVGAIVGIVFGVLFGVILIAVLVWWTYRKGYCDNLCGKSEPEEIEDDGSNDIMLDGHGPIVHKPESVTNGSTGKLPDGAIRVMP